MPYENEKNEKRPVGNYPGAKLQKDEYDRHRRGEHTTRPTIPEGLHPQAPQNKGYPKRPK